MSGNGYRERPGRRDQLPPSIAALVAAGGPAILDELLRHMKAGETARFIGLAEQTVRDMTARGELPCVRPTARAVRYRKFDIIPWIEARGQRVAD